MSIKNIPFKNLKAKLPQVKQQVIGKTAEGIPLHSSYTEPRDLDLSMPGEKPYARGPYPTMYTQKAWTIRQYAGFSAAYSA